MKKEPFFILAGGYDTKNVGDYAMLLPLGKILNREGFALKVLSRHGEKHLQELYGVSEIIENYEYENRQQSEGRFFRGLNFGEDTSHLRKLAEEISKSEGVIIGGGRLLIDYTLDVMRGPLPYFGLLVTLCKFIGTPVFVYGMTLIENKSKVGSKLVRYILDNSERISVRDEESADVLKKIGCSRPAPTVIPDPAFCLEWTSASSLESKLVGITVRPISARWGGMTLDDYVSQMADTVDAIQNSNLGLRAQGIPHQFYGIDDPEYDDRYILARIHERSPFQGGYIEKEMLDLEEYRHVYSRLALLVGIRRHSFVFAALVNTPILPIAENPNASRLCTQLRTILPLPLHYTRTDFERVLADVLSRRKEICEKQHRATEELTSNLSETYTRWLFG
jgi:polysaccharide pyruvyl transferase WcaK-like protein